MFSTSLNLLSQQNLTAEKDGDPMKNQTASPQLSICIPTHHGRAELLCELLESIRLQIDDDIINNIQICISDNGSQDDTETMVKWYMRTYQNLNITYFRFSSNEGLRNFQNVISMAKAHHFWMIGSDDIVPPNSIGKVLHIISHNPTVSGITVNKLNFDFEYSGLKGSDHPIVLPHKASSPGHWQDYPSIVSNLCFLFCFISSHIINKNEWDKGFNKVGYQKFEEMRHFAYTAMLSEVARISPNWIWVPEYLITQRMGNQSVVQEVGSVENALQCTEDMTNYSKLIIAGASEYPGLAARLRRNIFLMYWNPLEILKYKADNPFRSSYDLVMLKRCLVWFSREPLFWATSMPILLTPGFMCTFLRWSRNKIFRMKIGTVDYDKRVATSFIRKLILQIMSTKTKDPDQQLSSLKPLENEILTYVALIRKQKRYNELSGGI